MSRDGFNHMWHYMQHSNPLSNWYHWHAGQQKLNNCLLMIYSQVHIQSFSHVAVVNVNRGCRTEANLIKLRMYSRVRNLSWRNMHFCFTNEIVGYNGNKLCLNVSRKEKGRIHEGCWEDCYWKEWISTTENIYSPLQPQKWTWWKPQHHGIVNGAWGWCVRQSLV